MKLKWVGLMALAIALTACQNNAATTTQGGGQAATTGTAQANGTGQRGNIQGAPAGTLPATRPGQAFSCAQRHRRLRLLGEDILGGGKSVLAMDVAIYYHFNRCQPGDQRVQLALCGSFRGQTSRDYLLGA